MSACKRLRVTPGVVENLMADGLHAKVKAGLALVGFVFYTGLVGIDEIIFTKFVWCEVRHDDVGTDHDGFFATKRINSLVCSGRHHVDFRHHEAQNGDHL